MKRSSIGSWKSETTSCESPLIGRTSSWMWAAATFAWKSGNVPSVCRSTAYTGTRFPAFEPSPRQVVDLPRHEPISTITPRPVHARASS
jgi:hypothetical protein